VVRTGVVGFVIGVLLGVGIVVGVLLGVVVGVLGVVVVDVTGVCVVDLTGVGVVDPTGMGVVDPAGVLVVVPAGPLLVDPVAGATEMPLSSSLRSALVGVQFLGKKKSGGVTRSIWQERARRPPQQPSWRWFSLLSLVFSLPFPFSDSSSPSSWHWLSFLSSVSPCRFVVFRFVIAVVSSLLGAAFPCLFRWRFAGGFVRVRGAAFANLRGCWCRVLGLAFGGHRVGAVWCEKRAVWWVGSKRCGGGKQEADVAADGPSIPD